MRVSRMLAWSSSFAVVCAAALVGAAASTAATPKKPAVPAPVNCAKLIPASVAESLTKLGITSVTSSTKKLKGGWLATCRYHTATDTGNSSAISVDIYPATAANRTAFAKSLVRVAARARDASFAPECQPGYKVPDGSPPVEESDCYVMHPLGGNSFEFGDTGLVVSLKKYLVDDVSIHGDDAQEALMRGLVAKLGG